jgi:hypothetical protein
LRNRSVKDLMRTTAMSLIHERRVSES